MTERFADIPRDVREQIAGAIREREAGLTEDAALVLAQQPGLTPPDWRELGRTVIVLLANAVEDGEIDERSGTLRDLSAFSPPLGVRELIAAVHRVERMLLDEVALHERLGATSERWPIVAHSIRTAMLEIIAAHVEHDRVRPRLGYLRDSLTTLVTAELFHLVLEQEILRAQRHHHGISVILFDVDDLSEFNRLHGYGAGDRLLERLGIMVRRYFRTHDWVARHGEDSIAVLLPETTLDQAAMLANGFREMFQQRMVLIDHKTDTPSIVTVTAAAVGTDHVQSELEADHVLSEAETALFRAKISGRNRVERVALAPTSVTIAGAATLLGTSVRAVVKLIRGGVLRSVRRGRHYHIDRSQIEEYKRGMANREG